MLQWHWLSSKAFCAKHFNDNTSDVSMQSVITFAICLCLWISLGTFSGSKQAVPLFVSISVSSVGSKASEDDWLQRLLKSLILALSSSVFFRISSVLDRICNCIKYVAIPKQTKNQRKTALP